MFFSLNDKKFSNKNVNDLFHNIMIDDEINLDSKCPSNIIPICSQIELEKCYILTWQMLVHSTNFKKIRNILFDIIIKSSVSPEEQMIYKQTRAKFKHMRFGCSNFDKRHVYPKRLHFVTSLMGFLQDSFKNNQKFKTRWTAILLWIILHPLIFKFILKRLNDFQPDTPENLNSFQLKKIKDLAKIVTTRKQVTGQKFHSLRKIISRHTAYIDTLRVIRPSKDLDKLSIYLATVNGLMGDMHDRLLEKHINKEINYYNDVFYLPDIINLRLENIVSCIIIN